MAAAESPPPIIVIPSTFDKASASAYVPFAKGSISKTPIGPFQITVFAVCTTWLNISLVFSPISMPI